ncbi:hypothetical protein IT413_05060 [Candidatus Peregrinibacteria bacterium]|nr:hypothetical protein [Candidatus Peregrinibacteria bacterium]
MNFAELKEIIKQLKKIVPCSQCNKKFIEDGIRVLTTIQNEGLFHMSCFNCNNQVIVHVTISEQEGDEIEQTLPDMSKMNIRTHRNIPVNENDILDIHNFLNSFNGDFKEFFTKES